MGIPLFLIFATYGVVNTYLPILLHDLGYGPTMIGVLQGLFEGAGLLFPVFISSKVDRKGNYGLVLILLAVMMVLVLPPLVAFPSFGVTAAALMVFAVGFKGTVPVADAFVSRSLGPKATNYGKVRVLGTVGFVCITVLFQFTRLIDPDSPKSIALWMGIPTALLAVSVAFIPGLLRPRQTAPRAGNAANGAGNDSHGAGSASPAPVTARPRLPFLDRGFSPSFWIGISLFFLGFLGLTPSQRFFSLYVQEYLGLNSYAGLWALSAAAEVPFMFLSGRFIRCFGTVPIILASLVAIGARNLVYAAFPSFGGAVAGQLFHSVCFGLFHPAAVVFVTERVSSRLTAVGLTLYTSVSVGIASVLGNVLGGLVIDLFGYRALFVTFTAFPLVGIAIAFALGRVLVDARPARGV